MVLGHEGAGVIEELGAGVTGLEVGDHVVVSWVPQCGECFFCKKGQGFLCEAGQTAMMTGGLLDGTTRFSRGGQPITQMACSGTFSQQAVIPAIGAVKIPKDVPLDGSPHDAVLTASAAAHTATSSWRHRRRHGCGRVVLNVIGTKIAGPRRYRRRRAGHKLDMPSIRRDHGGPEPATAIPWRRSWPHRAAGVDVAFEVIVSTD